MSDSRVVLITGAASAISRRMAERFLEQGDSVHICDSSRENVAFKCFTRNSSSKIICS